MHEVMTETQFLPSGDVSVSVEPLAEADRTEVLAFLAEQPIHNVCMAGFIRDNGMVSPDNRGTFFGCRNSEGRLEGVALFGHATFFDARTDRALQGFAAAAQSTSNAHMILGEHGAVERFWNLYADEGKELRRACRENLFKLDQAVEQYGEEPGLRLASPDDLELIVPVHASMAFAESGVDPLITDAAGFRQRCLRRIEKERTWVLVKDEQLIFKADIVADTPDVVYLEGIYVALSERGNTVGRRCLSGLCRKLLIRTRSICVLVNEDNQRAHSFYRICNFKLRHIYDTIFVQRDENKSAN